MIYFIKNICTHTYILLEVHKLMYNVYIAPAWYSNLMSSHSGEFLSVKTLPKSHLNA